MMKTFKILSNNKPPMTVTGELIGVATGVYHSLQVIHTAEDYYVAFLMCDYGEAFVQLAFRFKKSAALREWLTLFDDSRIYRSAVQQACKLSLRAGEVGADLLAVVSAVYRNGCGYPVAEPELTPEPESRPKSGSKKLESGSKKLESGPKKLESGPSWWPEPHGSEPDLGSEIPS